MITKKKVIETINALPDDKFNNIEAVIEELILLEKVEKGLDDLKSGNVISDDDLDKEIEKW